jgi:hypothetical protein
VRGASGRCAIGDVIESVQVRGPKMSRRFHSSVSSRPISGPQS